MNLPSEVRDSVASANPKTASVVVNVGALGFGLFNVFVFQLVSI